MRKRMLAVLLSVVMVLGMLPVTASAGEEDDSVYLALGDSITTGYAPDGKVDDPFADQVAAAQGYELTNLAEDGETSASLLTKLTSGAIDVTNTDLITITIGGNDLMGALYAYLAVKWSADHTDDPKTAQDIQAMLINLDPANLGSLQTLVGYLDDFALSTQASTALTSFTANLTAIVNAIKNANPDTTILVATQYNPYYYLAKTYGGAFTQAQTISTAFEAGLTSLNEAISDGVTAGYQVVDVCTAFKTAADDGINPCNPSYTPLMTINLDFHPNQIGHNLIAEAINNMLPKQNYSLSVGGTTVTSQNANDVLDDGTVRYDAATNTLKLNNANIDYAAGNAVFYYSSNPDFIIELSGENYVSSRSDYDTISASSADLVLQGSGSLEISSANSSCIFGKSVHITSGEYTFNPASGWWDVYAYDTIEISGSDTVITSGANSVFGGDGDIILNGAKFKRLYWLYSSAGNISISDCEIDSMQAVQAVGSTGEVSITDSTISIPDSSFEIPIYGSKDITISGGELTVGTVYGANAIPVYSEDGNIQINNGAKLNVTSNGLAGIYAGGKVVIDGNGGTVVDVNATGYGQSGNGSTGIHSAEQMTIQNGAVVRVSGTRLGLGSNYTGDLPIMIVGSWVETTASNSSKGVGNSVVFQDGVGQVYGTALVPGDMEIGADMTLTVPEEKKLTVPDGAALTNNGTFTVEGIMEVSSTGQFTGAADVSGKVYVFETGGEANPVEGAVFTLEESGEVYAQLTALSGTTIQPAYRTSGSYSYTTVNGTEESFANRWSYYRGSSSSGITTYTSTAETVENGTVTISPKNASKGTEVTVTVTPDEGYVLESLTVTDKNGTEIELTDQGDGKYSFIMPASNVKIDAVFTEEEPASTLPFSDVASDDWFCEAVQYVFDNGMMNGVGNDSFAPDSNLTRGMVAQVLYNLEDAPEAGSDAFGDVEAGQWYADAVNWAAANDIVSGYDDSTFGPQKDITREQMAQILYNYAVFKGYDVSAQGDLSAFEDGSETSDWALPAMKWAVGSGLLQGYAGRLNPDGTATRAEVAQILMNFCENIVMK